jgi:hypothetical protein
MGSKNACGCTQNAENGFGFDFLEQCHKDDDKFLSYTVLVTGDKTWVSCVNAGTKEQSAVKAVNAHTFTKEVAKVHTNICLPES